MKMRRLLSCIMALLLAASLPVSALADTYDLAEGSVTVNVSEGSEQTVTHKETTKPDSAPVITQSGSGTTSNTITINADAGSTANVTLKDVNIDASGTNQAAVEVTGSGDVVIELDGTNTVQSGDYHAGVEKDNVGSLTITDENGTDGSLKATGGAGGAGIGGGYESSVSDITISGGTVNAIGGDAPSYGDELEPGGGAGIGGGVYGTGDNIAVEKDAIVTATGDGYAADIGDGYKHSTQKQSSEVNVSGLYTTGSVTTSQGKTQGTKEPPKDNDNGQSSGSSGGNSGGVGIYSDDDDTIWGNILYGIVVAADAKGITASDNDGNDLSSAIWLKEDSMEVSVKEDNVLVSGNKADLLQLTVEGVKQINLETNRVNVSVSNEVLNKITSTGGSFQLSTDDTTVNLTATDQNNKKTLDMTLTANKLSDTQAAPGQSSKQPVAVSIDSQSNTGNNSEGGTLQVSTNAPEATLSLDQKYLQTLMNSEFSKLALAVGNVLATVESMLAANTAVNGTGSITIGDTTVNMNGFKFSAGDSSENDKLADMVNNIQLTMENQSQGSSAMVVEVDAKASLQSASLEVPGSALQSLMNQGVEETALSINGKTTSITNSNLQKQFDDSQLGSKAVINVKHLANDEIETWVDKVDEDGNVIVSVDSL